MGPRPYSVVVGSILFTRMHAKSKHVSEDSSNRDEAFFTTPIEDADVLKTLGLSCLPSAATVPDGWDIISARDVGDLRTIMNNNTYSANLSFLDTGSDCAAGRAAWKKMFSNRIASRINKAVQNIMFEYKVHPKQIMKIRETNDLPSGTTLSRAIGAEVADLFGPGARELATGLHYDNVANASSTICGYVLRNIQKTQSRAASRLKDLEKGLDAAMKPLYDNSELVYADVKRANDALKKYNNSAEWLPLALSKSAECQALIDEVFESTGLKLTVGKESLKEREQKLPPKQKAAAAKGRSLGKTKKMVLDRADCEDVERLISSFTDYFEHEPTNDSFDFLEEPMDSDMQALLDRFPDLGVEDFVRFDESQLSSLLALTDNRPIHWNPLRSEDSAKSPWNDADVSIYIEGSPGVKPLQLLWHQMVGVASMVSKLWTETEGVRPPGVLLADAVGVGKTAQVMAVIAFIQHVYMSETLKKDYSRPPIITNKPYFMGRGPVPNLPHLLVLPLSLVGQWISELRTFFKPKEIDIFDLSGNDKEVEKSLADLALSKHEPVFRIVLISLPTFSRITSNIFKSKIKRRREFPDDVDASSPLSIFGMDWGTVWLEEAHDYRTSGTRQFFGALALRKKAYVVNALTATPLYTSPKDPINIGRLIGIKGFLGPSGYAFELDALRAIARAKRSLTREDKERMAEIQAERMSGSTKSYDDDPALQVQSTQYAIVRGVQKLFSEHFIRRTPQSKRLDGKTAINDQLQMYEITQIPVVLPAHEKEALDDDIEDFVELGMSRLEAFFTAYRTKIAWPGFYKEQEYPTFKTLQDWNNNPGWKLTETIRLIKHLLSDDNVEMPKWDEESSRMVYPEPRTYPDGESPPRTRKILFSFEWTMMAQTIQSALEVNGVQSFLISGKLSPKARDAAIQDFIHSTDPEKRILLFSSVGSTGLNLACAVYIIVFDMLWSGVALQQIIGRAWRLGQTLQVRVFLVVALGTTDITMTTMASGKDAMLNAFMSKARNEAVEAFIAKENEIVQPFLDDNDPIVDVESDVEEDVQQTKRRATKRKSIAKAVDEVSEIDGDAPKEKKKKAGEAKTATSKGAGDEEEGTQKKKGTSSRKKATGTMGNGEVEIGNAGSSEKKKKAPKRKSKAAGNDKEEIEEGAPKKKARGRKKPVESSTNGIERPTEDPENASATATGPPSNAPEGDSSTRATGMPASTAPSTSGLSPSHQASKTPVDAQNPPRPQPPSQPSTDSHMDIDPHPSIHPPELPSQVVQTQTLALSNIHITQPAQPPHQQGQSQPFNFSPSVVPQNQSGSATPSVQCTVQQVPLLPPPQLQPQPAQDQPQTPQFPPQTDVSEFPPSQSQRPAQQVSPFPPPQFQPQHPECRPQIPLSHVSESPTFQSQPRTPQVPPHTPQFQQQNPLSQPFQFQVQPRPQTPLSQPFQFSPQLQPQTTYSQFPPSSQSPFSQFSSSSQSAFSQFPSFSQSQPQTPFSQFSSSSQSQPHTPSSQAEVDELLRLQEQTRPLTPSEILSGQHAQDMFEPQDNPPMEDAVVGGGDGFDIDPTTGLNRPPAHHRRSLLAEDGRNGLCGPPGAFSRPPTAFRTSVGTSALAPPRSPEAGPSQRRSQAGSRSISPFEDQGSDEPLSSSSSVQHPDFRPPVHQKQPDPKEGKESKSKKRRRRSAARLGAQRLSSSEEEPFTPTVVPALGGKHVEKQEANKKTSKKEKFRAEKHSTQGR
ncbi:P-loop containing nucleoside triphosphate hydrolase protein [Pluteus cervinus]|uniref:P-loop containing nucleoside triphosphate hydrolase protein n=1 Tax=Pluteus cervinus TaxID=181527 RepID=A0ACD3A3X9_9AGAR|nr:P-loop containing nucleoside triphosphate hydrolase protein [Pluteus cervinus]